MDEEYTESVDTSSDMDASDVDVADDVAADIPDDIPEDVPEDTSSDMDMTDDITEDVSNYEYDDSGDYDETDDFIDEDTVEPSDEAPDDDQDEIPEDTYEDTDETFEVESDIDDIPEDTDESNSDSNDRISDVDGGDIPEDTDMVFDQDTESSYEEDIPEDVTDFETTDETADVEDTDTAEQPQDVTDAETTDETADVEDTDTAEQQENIVDAEAADESAETEDTTGEQTDGATDAETTDETSDVEDTDAAEQPEDVTDNDTTDEAADTTEQPEDATALETADETSDVEDTDAAEQSEDMTDVETTDETGDVAEQPQDVSDTEAMDETDDVADDMAEQSQNAADAETTDDTSGINTDIDDSDRSDLETYDYETAPETQDSVNPETSGEYVSAENPYRERWEEFAEEFSEGDDKSADGDSLKDVPFARDEQGEASESTDTSPTAESSETPEINSVSDYMNAHNYGPDDFATYSQDPQWRQLMRQEYPDYELPDLSQESANAQLSQYMNDHNYGVDDYAEYSQDPVWRELHSAAFPDDELPSDAGDTEQSVEQSAVTDDDLTSDNEIEDKEQELVLDSKDLIDEDLFGSFETDKHINGSDYFVKGDNYDKFKADYYSPEESTYEAYDTPKQIDISPSMIEGIHLGVRDVEDPSTFWSQHETGGTLESFKDIASRIPNVREQLASGKTLDDLLADPELSECASIYFANKPKVIENDGYYEFDSNGRHRILAAREARYDIPVEVVGRRNRSAVIETNNSESVDEELHTNFGEDLSKQNARDDNEFGSFADKIRYFFKPSQNTDFIEPSSDVAITPDHDIQAKWAPPAIKGVDVKEPTADIAPLETTRQSINMVDLPDGSKGKVFDHPDNLKNTLPFSQGENEYAKRGTCALADTGAWLKIAGSKHVENDVVGFASTHTDRQGNPLCSRSGGTLPSNIPDIWEHFGMPAYSDGSKNLESIAEAVESGRAVSVGVNAGTLWEMDNSEGIKIPQDCYGDGGANHAIGVMSCERDPISGNITHFYINDTGRTYERDACRKISIADFWKAFNVKRACATISKKPVW